MKKQTISLKAERETLILAIKELVSASHRLARINEDNSSLAELYRKTLLDAEMQLSNICSEIGNMVGYTVYSDICEGLEVKP